MRNVHQRSIWIVGAFLGVACNDQRDPSVGLAPNSPGMSVSLGGVRSRIADTTRSWNRRSDDTLWNAIVTADSNAVVGVMNPGAGRGVWKGRLLISASEKGVAHAALTRLAGVRVMRELQPLPSFIVHFDSRAAFETLRRLPSTDYIEPTRWREPKSIWQSSGCGSSGSGDASYSTPEGDVYGWSYDYGHHNVVDAWMRSSGDNVRVAILDTGLDPAQSQLNADFATGMSANRSLFVGYSEPASSSPEWRDLCGHGTRVIGAIAAPRDGRGMVGIAYNADILSMRVGSDVVDWFNEIDVYDGLTYAVGAWHAKVVEMAFGASNYSELISDYIQMTYYNNGPVYIAAMGNDYALVGGAPNATFPAEMDEVIGVVALDADGSRNPHSNWGPSADVAAFVPATSAGNITMGDPFVSYIGQTSGASATIAGIAALVYAVHPTWSNTQVRDRLQLSGSHPHDPNWQNGHGPVNAYIAVGGTRFITVEGPLCAPPGEVFSLQANPDGDGPYAFRWSTGSTADNILVTASPTIGGHVAVDVEVTDLITGQRFGAYREVTTVQYESGDCGPGSP